MEFENINSLITQLSSVDSEFYNEVVNMEYELKKIDDHRKEYVQIAREKIRNHIKTGSDAIKYLPKYIQLSHKFRNYQYEGNILCIDDDAPNSITSRELLKLAKELCGQYYNIRVDAYGGYCIYLDDKSN
jgi:hypothetical protein